MEIYTIKKIIENNDINLLKKIIKNKEFDPSQYNNIAIRYACMLSKNEIFDFLFKDKRVDPFVNNCVCLCFSLEKNNYHITQKLLKNITFKPNKHSFILYAIKSNNIEILKILLEHKELINNNKHSLLNAATFCNIEFFNFLLKQDFIHLSNNEQLIYYIFNENKYDFIISLINDGRINLTFNSSYLIINSYKKNLNHLVELLWQYKNIQKSLKNDNLEIYNKLKKEEIKNKIKSF